MLAGDRRGSYLGTISLKSSILRRPAGVSPMLISMKTTGRVVLLLELITGDGGGKVLDEAHDERVVWNLKWLTILDLVS